jgi:hypothetical protein
MQCAAYLRVAALYPAFSRARVVWRVRASDRRARRHHRVQAVPLASGERRLIVQIISRFPWAGSDPRPIR